MLFDWGNLNWGDVPTWLGAVTTSLAFVAAAWVVRIELRRDKEGRESADRSEQAALIAV